MIWQMLAVIVILSAGCPACVGCGRSGALRGQMLGLLTLGRMSG